MVCSAVVDPRSPERRITRNCDDPAADNEGMKICSVCSHLKLSLTLNGRYAQYKAASRSLVEARAGPEKRLPSRLGCNWGAGPENSLAPRLAPCRRQLPEIADPEIQLQRLFFFPLTLQEAGVGDLYRRDTGSAAADRTESEASSDDANRARRCTCQDASSSSGGPVARETRSGHAERAPPPQGQVVVNKILDLNLTNQDPNIEVTIEVITGNASMSEDLEFIEEPKIDESQKFRSLPVRGVSGQGGKKMGQFARALKPGGGYRHTGVGLVPARRSARHVPRYQSLPNDLTAGRRME
ncbi:hypothetical protein Bbelb_166950 [Branchiostoma belcheri]|nr:hypothetical protein Bbelb_166950 [Branchiostoma belcheri]